ARTASPLEVRLHVGDLHVNAVDDPRRRQPAGGLLALQRMPLRTPVVGPGPAEEDRRTVQRELRVRDPAPLVREALARLLEAERLAEPIDRGTDVLVRDNRDRAGSQRQCLSA